MTKSLPFEFKNINLGTTESVEKMFEDFYDAAQVMLEGVDNTSDEVGIVMNGLITNGILMN